MINVDKFVYNDEDVLEFIVLKHGSHNQETHGNWATGGEGQKITGLINKLYEKKTPGFSINIKSRRTPKTGYMCSEKGFEKTISVEDFYKTRDGARKYLVDYMKQNSESLSKRGAYFGAWVDGGKVYLDVSRRYESRQAGVDAGVSNEQQAIYDIKNDSFIYTGGNDGEANKAVADRSSESSESDDGRGIVRIRRRDSERDGQLEDDDFNPLEDETLTVHISNGRTLGIKPGEFVTKKHEQHDQSSHGNWASFGGDSSILARNGAKEYSEQNNIKQDTSITYKDVVANRARASRIADAYDKLPDFDKEAVDEFESLGREVNKQYDFMTRKLGVKVEFVSNDPYKTSKEMFADVSKKRLKVLSTKATGGHPVFTDEQNDRFRAVHDFFGHAATGRGFGQDGEEAAWVHHSQMFTPKARLALTTETRGQNSWYNTRKNGFAKQKVALLPSEFVVVPEVFEKHGTHDQSSHAGSRRRIGSDATATKPKRPQGEQEVTDPNAPKPKLKPGRKPDASGTVEQRAEKLANGERIQVTQKEAKQIMDIMSKREDNPDLTNMHVENTRLYDEDNLGIPRNKMPQVPSDTKAVYITEMEKRGARVVRGVADPAKLHPIQAEMSASKVGLIMKKLREKGTATDDGGRIIISKDNYVIDGHHRWAAAAMLTFEGTPVKLPVIKVDMNHKDLIDATLAWNEATGIKPIGMGESNKPGQVRKAWAEFDFIIAKAIRSRTIVRFQPGLKPVVKHQSGNHDQESHGNWAGEGGTSKIVNNLQLWNENELSKFSSSQENQNYLNEKMLSQVENGFQADSFKKVVRSYQGAYGREINEALRDPLISEEQWQDDIDGLDNAIKAAPGVSEPTIVYRGIRGNGLDFFNSLKSGDVFQDKGFISTTLDTQIAFDFATAGNLYEGVVMKIKLPIGTKGLFPAGVTGLEFAGYESEFILPRDSKLKIVNNKGKVWDVEVVND
jgi:hypothetical protein